MRTHRIRPAATAESRKSRVAASLSSTILRQLVSSPDRDPPTIGTMPRPARLSAVTSFGVRAARCYAVSPFATVGILVGLCGASAVDQSTEHIAQARAAGRAVTDTLRKYAQRPHPASFSLEVASTIGRGQLGVLVDGVVRPDGSVCVIDYSASIVNCYAPVGTLLMTIGRKGQGPGEFELPYRVTVDASGGLIVYDLSARAMSWFTPDGRFLVRRSVPIGFSQVNSLKLLPSGVIAIAGYAPRAGKASSFGIHLFNDTLAYLRSFGPLPTAKDPVLLEHWGSGTLSVLDDRRLAYSKVAPAEILFFDEAGRDLGRLKIPNIAPATLDAGYLVERLATGTSVGASPNEFPRLATVLHLPNGDLAVNRWQGGERDLQFWDLYVDGRLVQSIPVAPGWGSPIGTADGQRTLWSIGDQEGEPVLRSLRIRP